VLMRKVLRVKKIAAAHLEILQKAGYIVVLV
jgi:hypothetical protein